MGENGLRCLALFWLACARYRLLHQGRTGYGRAGDGGSRSRDGAIILTGCDRTIAVAPADCSSRCQRGGRVRAPQRRRPPARCSRRRDVRCSCRSLCRSTATAEMARSANIGGKQRAAAEGDNTIGGRWRLRRWLRPGARVRCLGSCVRCHRERLPHAAWIERHRSQKCGASRWPVRSVGSSPKSHCLCGRHSKTLLWLAIDASVARCRAKRCPCAKTGINEVSPVVV